ncbi:MAG: hypothetical protein D6706_20095, partial [Chloroflexi bacterium]
LGPIQASTGERVAPGQRVTFTLAGLVNGKLDVEPETGLLHFVGSDGQGATQQWYLPTNVYLNRQLQRIVRYNLAGVMVDDLFAAPPTGQTWTILRAFRARTEPLPESNPNWVWTITKQNDSSKTVLAETQPLDKTGYTWTAPDTGGEFQINVELSMAGDEAPLPVASLMLKVEAPSTPTPTPTPTSTASGGSLASNKPTPTRTATPRPATPVAPSRASSSFLLAYTKWDGHFHDLYIADSRTGQTQLILTHAAGPSFSTDKKRLFFIGEQGVDQQIREGRVACTFGTISEGIVSIDLTYPVQDICQVQSDVWTCERKEIDVGRGPSDVCTANNVSVYQNLDWKVGSARWTRVAPDNDSVVYDAKPGGGYRIYFRAVDPTSQQFH